MTLRRVRQAKGLSQTALAKRARLSRVYVNNLEGGKYDPTLRVLKRLAKALGVPVTALVR